MRVGRGLGRCLIGPDGGSFRCATVLVSHRPSLSLLRTAPDRIGFFAPPECRLAGVRLPSGMDRGNHCTCD
ncbi:hypothetical protein MLP_51080 [Microlunatus phosphovorus NM-1]|uniref:Uncharacterized protein n=1 Tax=Microlunatus phosphovorus (strain ATCC 700054 / DSM 10555 / JCM 9379 / NBRC 101784 / NCIMB 13414 / VKM Ac-1990 / NM-1) TaxID=1032480 RepID=F5XHB4_MICPN|nr:hypothetical protein MLP_51080 [Microlunatus phosphovorus NM-1]